MNNTHKHLMADRVGVVYCAALGVSLAESRIAGQPVMPFTWIDQRTRNGP